MTLKLLLNKVEKSKEYKEWKKNNPKSYLVHFFIIFEKNANENWQLGFYEPNEDKLATFTITDEKITLDDHEEIFKKEPTKIKQIDINKIKIDNNKAIEIASNIQKNKYSAHIPLKIIVILQNLETQLWNITYVTQTFNTLNIKIDAENGNVIDEKLTSLMDFRDKANYKKE